MNQLRPYQIDGAAWLTARKNALLADEMGLGKTVQAIKAAQAAGADTVVVVCPASVCETWRRELKRWWPINPPAFPIVTSYDRAGRGDLDLVSNIDVLILDEVQYLKSATAKRTRDVLGFDQDGKRTAGLVDRADRVICLSGTPMPNHPAEMWPVLRALAPETILSTAGKPYAYWSFVKKYCKTKDNGFGLQIIGAKNHAKLAEALKPFMLRRLKRDVLTELPPIAFEPLYVEGAMPKDSAALAQAWAAAEILDSDGIEGLSKANTALATLRRLTGLAKVPACIEWIKDFLESGRKLVVFAYHREVIEALVEGLLVFRPNRQLGEAADMRKPIIRLLTGETTQAHRVRAVDEFQTKPDVRLFLGQIQAAGTGITLTAASDVLFVESDWVPANIQQAAMRVHRIGQSEPCLVRFATLAGSIDEDIQRALVRKASDIEKVVG